MRNIFFILSLITFNLSYAQITKEWVSTFNGHGDFNDQFTCAANDQDGNIVVAGSTTNPNADRDYLVCKFQPNGTLIWKTYLNGSGSGTDEITAIAIDAQNNIYVTGFSKGNNTSTDFLTVKYNPNGDTIWTRSYDFIAEYDQANSIAVDGSGNIYVCGQSDSDPSAVINDDYLTIKYNPSGNMLWTKRFNGIGNAIDRPVKIVLDNNANCYITGRSNNGTDDDFVTIKYNSTGVQSWIKYDDRGGWDRASAMAIDGANNIYITGKSQNNANYDFWTLKYSSTGNLQYQQVFDFVDDDNPNAIYVDNNGNCYVTGASDADATAGQNFDFQTVAYSSGGQQLWQKRMNGTANNDDLPIAISVNSTAVVVSGLTDKDPSTITSNNGLTIAYATSNGAQLWMNEVSGSTNNDDALQFNLTTGNATAVLGFSEDNNNNKNAIIEVYSLTGSQNWNYSFSGLGDNNENLRGITVDNSNNIYLTGYSVQKGANRNMLYLKVAADGQLTCSYDLDGSATGSTDDSQGIVLDNNGNPILAGFLRNKASSNDIEIVSINNQSCDTNWTKTLDGIGHGSDKVYDIQKDNAGFIYITGRQDVDNSNNSNDNCYTAKINQNGTVAWQKLYNSSGIFEDRGEHLRLSSQGNIYVLGKSWNGNTYDVLILKYDANGNQIWVQTFDSGKHDLPQDLAIDANENIYILANKEIDTIGIYDITLLKFTSSGQLSWQNNFDGGGNDQGVRLTEVLSNKITMLGTTDTDNSAATNLDILALSYDENGTQLWNFTFDGNAHADDIGDDIAFSDFGNIYLTGHTNKADSLHPNYDVITKVLDPNGVEIWSDIHNGSSDSSDIPNLLYLKGNDFYVAGSTVIGNEMKNTLLIKYSGIVQTAELNLQPTTFELFPNPTNETLFINLKGQQGQAQKISILHINGEEAYHSTITNPITPIDVRSLKPGIYFVKISNANQVSQIQKFIKVN